MKFQNISQLTKLTLSGIVLCSIMTAPQAFATDRKDSRDMKQEGRMDSRHAKDECTEETLRNGKCRRDKRDTKQDNRQESRDIKH